MDDAIRSGDVLHSSSPVSGYTSSHCALCTRGTQEDGQLIHGRWSSHVPHVCLILPRPIFTLLLLLLLLFFYSSSTLLLLFSYSLLRRLSFPYLHTERVTTKYSSSSSSSSSYSYSSSFSSSPSFQLILIFLYLFYFIDVYILLVRYSCIIYMLLWKQNAGSKL